MSNSKTPAKVLRVALKRIQKGWTKGAWSEKDQQTGVTKVCLEGAIYGYTNSTDNPACEMAMDLVKEVIAEKYPAFVSWTPGIGARVPSFNDSPNTTYEMAEEVLKLALIRAETGGLLRETEEECWK